MCALVTGVQTCALPIWRQLGRDDGRGRAVDIGVVRLDAETVERPGQEVEEGLAADFDALDLAAPAVGRLRDDIFDAVDRLRIAVGEAEALHLAVEAREVEREIGRASCRESGGKTV